MHSMYGILHEVIGISGHDVILTISANHQLALQAMHSIADIDTIIISCGSSSAAGSYGRWADVVLADIFCIASSTCACVILAALP